MRLSKPKLTASFKLWEDDLDAAQRAKQAKKLAARRRAMAGRR